MNFNTVVLYILNTNQVIFCEINNCSPSKIINEFALEFEKQKKLFEQGNLKYQNEFDLLTIDSFMLSELMNFQKSNFELLKHTLSDNNLNLKLLYGYMMNEKENGEEIECANIKIKKKYLELLDPNNIIFCFLNCNSKEKTRLIFNSFIKDLNLVVSDNFNHFNHDKIKEKIYFPWKKNTIINKVDIENELQFLLTKLKKIVDTNHMIIIEPSTKKNELSLYGHITFNIWEKKNIDKPSLILSSKEKYFHPHYPIYM